jgi:choloylglycine hydrolase
LASLHLPAQACTRALYFGKDGQVVTARSMDWAADTLSNLWVFPRGMARDGGAHGAGEKSLTWTSKYGSVTTSVYDGGTGDGMNEKGLVANLLYLADSKYPDAANDPRPTLVIFAWAQYVLDNFATVDEAVTELKKERYRMVEVLSPEGKPGTGHLSISDPSGDSAIFEYLNGKLVIHHGRQYQVMTNSPPFDQQLAMESYWKQIGGMVMLPGTHRASDRFARASFYINTVTQTADPREAVASVFSVIRNCSTPRGISTPEAPNLAPTIWRVVSDQKNLVYYFENTASPSLLWVKFSGVNFKEGAGAHKLTMVGHPDLGGDQTANFVKTEPYKFFTPASGH